MLQTILIAGISVVVLLIGVCAIAATIGAGRADGEVRATQQPPFTSDSAPPQQ